MKRFDALPLQERLPAAAATRMALWALGAALCVLALHGCANCPSGSCPQTPAAHGAEREQSNAPVESLRSGRAAPQVSVAGKVEDFSTRLASYRSVPFSSIPGWNKDPLSQGWPAFLASCQQLAPKADLWRVICQRSAGINGESDKAVRNFFERYFVAYQVSDEHELTHGLLTGYSEPAARGRANMEPPFIYPVYGEPSDMLLLDTRRLPRKGVVAAQVNGRTVAIGPALNTRELGENMLVLDLAQVRRDAPDHAMRLRIEGNELLPYYTREEIEVTGALKAPVLAYVSSRAALYQMQLLGFGRIVLPDGATLSLAYADYNGQPSRAASRQWLQSVEAGDQAQVPEDALASLSKADSKPDSKGAARGAANALRTSANRDRSYVFFKARQGNAKDTLGSMGMPLTVERSIAADLRSLPLGSPVFISTQTKGGKARIERLTFAQDRGAGFRKPLRADLFLGQGAQARERAQGLKSSARMWLLLARGQVVSATPSASPATGHGESVDGAAQLSQSQCLVPMEGVCGNER